MDNLGLIYDVLDRHADYIVTVFAPGVAPLVGFLVDEEFSINNSAAITGSIESILSNMLTSAIPSSLSKFSDMIRTSASTYQVYGGSDPINFSVTFVVFRGKVGMPNSWSGVDDAISTLTLPVDDSITAIHTLEYFDPKIMFQSLSSGSDILNGTLVNLSIGTWFSTGNILLVNSVNKVYSTAVDVEGQPLYCRVTIDFVTYKAFSHSNASSWFKG